MNGAYAISALIKPSNPAASAAGATWRQLPNGITVTTRMLGPPTVNHLMSGAHELPLELWRSYPIRLRSPHSD